jgi:DNA-binding LacI/PurR family transcriptional regulator
VEPLTYANLKTPAYQRIAKSLRNQILTGELIPGQKIPSNGELMEAWNSSTFTVHTAVQTLIKEGWIEAVRGTGTYVAHFQNRFRCAGIYHGIDIFSTEQASFSRVLHRSLLEQLHALGKDTLVFLDSRPRDQHKKILPSLNEAILHRRIQCLIAPTLNQFDSHNLSRLNLPTAFVASELSPCRLDFDRVSLIRDSVRNLARQGCRSIGIISNIVTPDDENSLWGDFYPSFRRAVQSEGLVTQPDWIREPRQQSGDLERHGYEEFKKIWALPSRPDGLIVYPDHVARGAIMGILDSGRQTVTQHMKFIFHRNSQFGFLCPVPATWAISDEAQLATELIRMIQKQFDGEKISPVLIPHSFKGDPGEV